jgi:hypothetical protein
MSEPINLNKQCVYCRRFHALGYCAFGVSNGRESLRTVKPFKGNLQKKPTSLIDLLKSENYKKARFKDAAFKAGWVKKRVGKARKWFRDIPR